LIDSINATLLDNEGQTMNHRAKDPPRTPVRKRRRWLLGMEPIFEGGWLHKGRRARTWDVEDELTALALLGDVTIDLAGAKSAPAEVSIHAYAILRDVDVLVTQGTEVELTGRARNDHLNNHVPPLPDERSDRVVRVRGHTLLGDVTARIA